MRGTLGSLRISRRVMRRFSHTFIELYLTRFLVGLTLRKGIGIPFGMRNCNVGILVELFLFQFFLNVASHLLGEGPLLFFSCFSFEF